MVRAYVEMVGGKAGGKVLEFEVDKDGRLPVTMRIHAEERTSLDGQFSSRVSIEIYERHFIWRSKAGCGSDSPTLIYPVYILMGTKVTSIIASDLIRRWEYRDYLRIGLEAWYDLNQEGDKRDD